MSNGFRTHHHSSDTKTSTSSVDLELAPATTARPDPATATLAELRKGLGELQKRSKVVMGRAETSVSAVRRSNLGRGEPVSQRKTQTESFAIKAGGEETANSVSATLSKHPPLDRSLSPSLYSSIKVPPKTKRNPVTFRNDTILEEREEDKGKAITPLRYTETRSDPSSELIPAQHAPHTDCRPTLAIMPAEAPVKTSALITHGHCCQNCNMIALEGNDFCDMCRKCGHGEVRGPYPGYIPPLSNKVGTADAVMRASAQETEEVEQKHWSREWQRKEKDEKREQPKSKQNKGQRKVEGEGGGGVDGQRRLAMNAGSKSSRDSKSGQDLLREETKEKERRFREFQRSKGRKESEIEGLPSNSATSKSPTPPPMYSLPSPSPAKRGPRRHRVEEQKREREQSNVPESWYENEERMSRKMATLRNDGQRMLDSFKVCLFLISC